VSRATAQPTLPPLPGADRIWITASLVAVAALGWLYLIRLDHAMNAMQPMFRPWRSGDFALTVIMWWAMMAGMMLPSALPMVTMFARINRNKREHGKPTVPTMVFAAGYLLAWGAYSLAATGIQWALESLAVMSPMGAMASPVLGGLVFLAAGVYQFTSLKHTCLQHCRSPLSFILNAWRDRAAGALRMGAIHGSYCLGCCWVLMSLLFVVGVMNLLWVAAIAMFVIAEKRLPAPVWVSRVSGAAMCAWGAFLIASA